MNMRSWNVSIPIRICLTTTAALLIGMAAITRQSLWMDEGGTAFRALMPTLEEWWRMLLHLRGSDVQMPLYMFLAWLWHQAGALSEYALRAANLPWLVIAALALGRVRFWPLVCLCSPFVLYYTGEFRPYAMQIAAGTMAASALSKVMSNKDAAGFDGVHALCFSCIFLLFSSLTGAVWAAGVALAALVANPGWLSRKEFWLKVAPWILPAAAAAAFYVYTLLQGYRATEVRGAGLLSIIFGFYEMAGLLGLGPARNELRGSPSAIIPWLWLLIPAAICIGASWLIGVHTWIQTVSPRCVAAAACAVVVPIIILAAIGVAQDFRVLGRHMSPVMPAVLLPIAASFTVRTWKGLPGAVPATVALLFMTWSSLNLRFLERHARDDFRQATELAVSALTKGKRVFWQAEMHTARYYAFRKGGFAMVNAIQPLESDQPSSLLLADVVFINRPELRELGVDYREKLERNFFKLERKFPGFEMWVAQ
jgi:hypothetical protein